MMVVQYATSFPSQWTSEHNSAWVLMASERNGQIGLIEVEVNVRLL